MQFMYGVETYEAKVNKEAQKPGPLCLLTSCAVLMATFSVSVGGGQD